MPRGRRGIHPSLSGLPIHGELAGRDEWIVAFPASLLDNHLAGSGFQATTLRSSQELLGACLMTPRSRAEADPSLIQLVSAFVVQSRADVLTYRRSLGAGEPRLGGEASIIFGGHLGPGDVSPLFSIFDTRTGAALLERELNEELALPRRPRFEFLGTVYDDSRHVSRQHLGIVYGARVDVPDFVVREPNRIEAAAFAPLSRLQSRALEFENWSQLVLPALLPA